VSKITVATTQFACTWDKRANIERAKNLVRAAAAEGANAILITPSRPVFPSLELIWNLPTALCCVEIADGLENKTGQNDRQNNSGRLTMGFHGNSPALENETPVKTPREVPLIHKVFSD